VCNRACAQCFVGTAKFQCRLRPCREPPRADPLRVTGMASRACAKIDATHRSGTQLRVHANALPRDSFIATHSDLARPRVSIRICGILSPFRGNRSLRSRPSFSDYPSWKRSLLFEHVFAAERLCGLRRIERLLFPLLRRSDLVPVEAARTTRARRAARFYERRLCNFHRWQVTRSMSRLPSRTAIDSAIGLGKERPPLLSRMGI